jgi:hypothetical protein
MERNYVEKKKSENKFICRKKSEKYIFCREFKENRGSDAATVDDDDVRVNLSLTENNYVISFEKNFGIISKSESNVAERSEL